MNCNYNLHQVINRVSELIVDIPDCNDRDTLIKISEILKSILDLLIQINHLLEVDHE